MSSVNIDAVNLFKRPQEFDPGKKDHPGWRLQTLTTTQRDALTGEGAAKAGSIIFNTTTAALEYYDGSGWSGVPISLTEAELGVIDGVTAGTILASKAIVVDSNKDAASARNFSATNLKAGADAVAGTVTVYPTTTAKGTAVYQVADQTGNTAVTHQTAAMGQATVITTPDPGSATASVVLTEGVQTINGVKTLGDQLNLVTGTAAKAPQKFTAGTNLTSAAAGAQEFDGVQYYQTIDTSSGRGGVPVEQYFHLTSAGSTISTIANYFGTTSNISLVASAYYIIDIYAWFLNTTSGTVVWTLTNSAAPTSQNIYYEMSPATGIVAPPGTATMLVGQVRNDATAALALTATAALTDAVSHYMRMKIFLQNGTGTSLKIQATKSAGTITPGINSYWVARRMSPNNIGTFAA